MELSENIKQIQGYANKNWDKMDKGQKKRLMSDMNVNIRKHNEQIKREKDNQTNKELDERIEGIGRSMFR